ncbi:DEAD/DEAH box helicase [Vibrio sp. B1Z05]|uniref:DEAD/DEAH box helicase n=1 Tax=Vibrio sp. B1Z05 TaxID=2654980 RepID=UPI00128CF8C1|nr:DEAD/DEAH box helicase [Vibrio sp. B1Z05]MPW35606.1 DEAD/DEAH box helicase [Vibrio sp. B1Z05]
MLSQSQVNEVMACFGFSAMQEHKLGCLYEDKHRQMVVVDFWDTPPSDYHYVEYTSLQNRLMHQYQGIYRFFALSEHALHSQLENFLRSELQHKVADIAIHTYGAHRNETHLDPTPPEFNFHTTFEEVFGSQYLYALRPEEVYIDLNGHRRYIDFVLHRRQGNIAIELNGERYHHPLLISQQKYLSQLYKQNSLVHDGLLVYRWSNRGMRDDFKFKEQLKDYFGDASQFKATPYFKGNRQVSFELYAHQKDAIESISDKRSQGQNTFLTVLPTGTGKTEVFIEDFRRQLQQGATQHALAIVPTVNLKDQLVARVQQQLPLVEISTEIDTPLDLTIVTNAAVVRNYQHLPSQLFDYILVDEAHRAAATGLSKALEYFTPRTLLGLTATDERLDQKKLEDIFGHYHVDLTLQQAMEHGLVPPIRVFRLESNIDFSKVRFNGKDFVKSDLQKTIQIPSRDHLIADILQKYFVGNALQKQGIIFCVDVKHTERMAQTLRSVGINAKSVHAKDRSAIDEYFAGEVQFLCACELLSEGWDAPQTSVVVMARPTMSKALYLQQLGRGTRLAPNKEALYVIDIIDNYGPALLQPWNLHNLFNIGHYRAFAEVGEYQHPVLQQELLVLDGLYEQERKIEPIDIFNFEQEFGDLFSEEQLARELFISTGTVRNWIKKQDITPTRSIPFGKSQLHYFSQESIEQIKAEKNIKPRTEATRFDDFWEFLGKRDYTFSYKIIFLLAFHANCDENGEAQTEQIAKHYQAFYQRLFTEFGQCEKENNPLNRTEHLQDLKYLTRSIANNPFEKFERKRFFYQSKELSLTAMDSLLWDKLGKQDWAKIQDQMIQDGINYFHKLGITLSKTYFEF